MSLSYANISTRILQLLQDTAGATYDSTELGYWIEDELKKISRYKPLFIDVIFQIESRSGHDTAGTASALTDATKAQFLAADATKEKVVHNLTDDTWAVILTNSSTSVNTLSRDIMAVNETYEIYNKRCRNKRQIYIGDMPELYRQKVVSVEYPIGKERNFFLLDDVIELDMENSAIADSDSTLSNLGKIDVLVRFAVPHILSQLTDWAGELTADAAEGATSIAVDGLGNTEIIEIGEQFHMENHRSVYIITAQVTTSANAATLTIYPGLEAASSNNDDITFRKSTLTPELEEILCQRVAARAMLSNTVTKLDGIPKGGQGTYLRERQWALDILAETERELRAGIRPIPYKTLPRT